MITRLSAYHLGWLLAVVACSSGNDGNAGAGGPPLDPPANIDVALCASVVGGSDQATRDACTSCCNNGGFPASAFHENKCVCGKPFDDDRKTVCMTQTDTSNACTTCCENAHFLSSFWIGGSSCTCSGKTDGTSCTSALSAPDPASACETCCLNHGYLGVFYVGIGTPECRCFDG